MDLILSYDVASGSEIKPCIKVDKPLTTGQPQNADLKADFNSFSDIFSVHYRAIDHLNLKLLILCWYTLSSKI